MPLLTGIALGASLLKMFSGASEKRRAQAELNNLERPKYEIPDTVKQALALAQQSYRAGMPGEQERRDDISRSSSNASAMAIQSGSPLLAISGIQANNDAASRAVNVDKANYSIDASGQLQTALSRFGEFKDRQWQMNEFTPYADKYNELTDNLAAGRKNLFNGIGELGANALSLGILG